MKLIFIQFIQLIPIDPDGFIKLKLLTTFHILLNNMKFGRIFVLHFQLWNGWKSPTAKHSAQQKTTAKDLLS
jgi:hypothetical protein